MDAGKRVARECRIGKRRDFEAGWTRLQWVVEEERNEEWRFHSKQKAKTRQLKAYPWLLPRFLTPATELLWSCSRSPSSAASISRIPFGVVFFLFCLFSIPDYPLPFHRGFCSFVTLPSRLPKTDSGLAFS